MSDQIAGTRLEDLVPDRAEASSLMRADTVVRTRRGKARKTLALIEAAYDIFEEIRPATVRAGCYRLFVAGHIESMSKNNTNAVSTQLVWAREQGIIPWDWIVDETREAERIQTWDNPDQIINAAVCGYRRDYWQDQPEWVEVWSEKGTVRGTLAPVLDRYGVTLRVMHGYGSATSLYGIAEETRNSKKPLTIFYVGDWDPSGLHMSEVDLPGRIARYEGVASIVRIALTVDDVGDELPSFDAATKTGDPRHQWFTKTYGGRCWELDALSPVTLRERVDSSIRFMLDQDAWDHAVGVEAVEVASMKSFLTDWNSKSGLARNCSVGVAR